MDVNAVLSEKTCVCGKKHTCEIEAVYIEKDAIGRLSALTAFAKNILLVADENTFKAAGVKTEKALSGKVYKKVLFSGESILIPNEEAIEEVRRHMGNTDLLIGIGSGVIQDLCKYVAFFAKIPYMIVATAPSMDGYASDGAAMILGGMKETVKAGLPKAIIADTEVLKNAPMEMIKAGYGDIIGKFSALCDWKLSRIINDEYFCPYIYDVTYAMIKETLKMADGLLKREEESVRALMEALTVVGIMMSFAGSSRPASGSEHHLSHFFEIVGIIDEKPYLPHGIDVAYGTVLTAGLREKIVNIAFPDRMQRPSNAEIQGKIKTIYKSVAEGCIKLQEKVGGYQNRMPIYKEKEAEIKTVLKECPGKDEIMEMLSKMDYDMQAFFDLYGKEKIEDAVLYAKDLKDRYTVLWLYFDLFGGAKQG